MRIGPRSLAGQMTALILIAFVVAQSVSLWLFAGERGAALQSALRIETAERAAAVVLALETADPAEHPAILQAARSHRVAVDLGDLPLTDVETGLAAVRATLSLRLGPDRVIRAEEVAVDPHGDRRDGPLPASRMRDRMLERGIVPAELRIAVQLNDGTWLNLSARSDRPDLDLPPAFLGTVLLTMLLVTAALWFGLRRITGPLRQLSQAAEEFGIDGPTPAMPQDGPAEVRALSEAMAQMQARISGMVAERTRMLAALGHDLRSPITALRLRAEMVDDDETRERMGATLDEMQDMVEATLAYARGILPDQPTEMTDLAALLADLARELGETGPAVTLLQIDAVTVPLRRTPMRRALRNLIENAQRYGNGAELSLIRGADRIEIAIDDHGPGIPDADLDRVFTPFTRLETSRSRETGGVGLGLSIAQAIVRAHGGTVRLSNREGGGVRARVTLPLGGKRDGQAD
jgi:signal transduction histidine kinase